MAVTVKHLLEHWEGHRRLTRRTVDTFPDDQLSSFTIGGMRTFGEMMQEVLDLEVFFYQGIASGEWVYASLHDEVISKEGFVKAFDAVAEQTQALRVHVTEARLDAVEQDPFGPPDTNRSRLLYVIDNEVHHRAQGFVYLRALGLEPPAFYER